MREQDKKKLSSYDPILHLVMDVNTPLGGDINNDKSNTKESWTWKGPKERNRVGESHEEERVDLIYLCTCICIIDIG